MYSDLRDYFEDLQKILRSHKPWYYKLALCLLLLGLGIGIVLLSAGYITMPKMVAEVVPPQIQPPDLPKKDELLETFRKVSTPHICQTPVSIDCWRAVFGNVPISDSPIAGVAFVNGTNSVTNVSFRQIQKFIRDLERYYGPEIGVRLPLLDELDRNKRNSIYSPSFAEYIYCDDERHGAPVKLYGKSVPGTFNVDSKFPNQDAGALLIFRLTFFPKTIR